MDNEDLLEYSGMSIGAIKRELLGLGIVATPEEICERVRTISNFVLLRRGPTQDETLVGTVLAS